MTKLSHLHPKQKPNEKKKKPIKLVLALAWLRCSEQELIQIPIKQISEEENLVHYTVYKSWTFQSHFDGINI